MCASLTPFLEVAGTPLFRAAPIVTEEGRSGKGEVRSASGMVSLPATPGLGTELKPELRSRPDAHIMRSGMSSL